MNPKKLLDSCRNMSQPTSAWSPLSFPLVSFWSFSSPRNRRNETCLGQQRPLGSWNLTRLPRAEQATIRFNWRRCVKNAVFLEEMANLSKTSVWDGFGPCCARKKPLELKSSQDLCVLPCWDGNAETNKLRLVLTLGKGFFWMPGPRT